MNRFVGIMYCLIEIRPILDTGEISPNISKKENYIFQLKGETEDDCREQLNEIVKYVREQERERKRDSNT